MGFTGVHPKSVELFITHYNLFISLGFLGQKKKTVKRFRYQNSSKHGSPRMIQLQRKIRQNLDHSLGQSVEGEWEGVFSSALGPQQRLFFNF